MLLQDEKTVAFLMGMTCRGIRQYPVSLKNYAYCNFRYSATKLFKHLVKLLVIGSAYHLLHAFML